MHFTRLILFYLLLTACNREAYQGTQLSPEADSLVQSELPSARKVKITGPVNITIQRGNGNVATPSAIGKVKADAAATGPGSTASATQAGTPWYVFAGLFVVAAVLGMWLRGRFSWLSFIR